MHGQPFLEHEVFHHSGGRHVHQIIKRITGDPIALAGSFIESRIKECTRDLHLQKPLQKIRPEPFVRIGTAVKQTVDGEIVAMIRRDAHQEKRDQKNIPRKRPDKIRIQRIKIITTGRHDNTADLRPKTDEKREPAQAKERREKDDQTVRAFVNELQKFYGKEAGIGLPEGVRQKIIFQTKEQRKHMKARGQRREDPEKGKPDRRPLIQK